MVSENELGKSPYAVHALAESVTLRHNLQNTVVTDHLRARVHKVS